MEELVKILKQIEEDRIVCPSPLSWDAFFQGVGGYRKNDRNHHKHFPLILGGWDASKEAKHRRFVDSVAYFYSEYPNKRDFIKRFFQENNKWYRWHD